MPLFSEGTYKEMLKASIYETLYMREPNPLIPNLTIDNNYSTGPHITIKRLFVISSSFQSSMSRLLCMQNLPCENPQQSLNHNLK